MRPGVHDIHDRIGNMNANGILASKSFPTFAGFSAGHLSARCLSVRGGWCGLVRVGSGVAGMKTGPSV
jgi:hypothetical protein